MKLECRKKSLYQNELDKIGFKLVHIFVLVDGSDVSSIILFL